uniref:Uncharacterized protein n=1 Tax=Parascaris univalens TaxID=6257 RepID=A0A915BTD5_PARUN
MDTVVLNVGHTQLEEQLKIAAACGIAEQNRVEENVDVDDDTELTVDDTNEGVHDHSMTSSSSDHDSSSDSPPPSTQRLLGDEFVKTLEQISKQQAAQLVANAGEAHPSQSGNYRTELKRPDLKEGDLIVRSAISQFGKVPFKLHMFCSKQNEGDDERYAKIGGV